jgi:hypothetical protein
MPVWLLLSLSAGTIAAIGLAAACNSCQPPAPVTPESVAWGALVNAGCAAPDPAGPLYVGLQLEAGAPAYLECLAAGAKVVSCGDGGDPVVTPCESGAP